MHKSSDEKKTKPSSDQDLIKELNLAKETILRAQADYQNLLRRTQEDRIKIAKLANLEIVLSLLEPLDHLELAAQQIKDPGLDMVIVQFNNALSQFGVEKIKAVGEKFNVTTMEVVEKPGQSKSDQDLIVTKVRKNGYLLNGEVIRHAKVVVS